MGKLNTQSKKRIFNYKNKSLKFIKKGGKIDYSKLANYLGKGTVGIAGLAALGHVYKNNDKIQSIILDNITKSSLSYFLSKYAFIFSPFGSSKSIDEASKEDPDISIKYKTSFVDKEFFYFDINILPTEQKKNDNSFFKNILDSTKDYSFTDRSLCKLGNIQRVINIVNIYSFNNDIEIKIDFTSNILTSQQFELYLNNENIRQNNFETGSSYWLCLVNEINNYLFVPVVIKAHLFSYRGVYLNYLKKTKLFYSSNSNLKNSNLYPIEFPFQDFLSELPYQMKENILLIPCFNTYPRQPNLNLNNFKKMIDDQGKDIDINDHANLPLTDSIQYISENPNDFILINSNVSRFTKPPFFIEDILNLFNSPLWIDEMVVNRTYKFFKDKSIEDISSYSKIIDLYNTFTKQKSNHDGNFEFNKIDIVPVIWSTSEKFKTFIKVTSLIAVGLAVNKTLKSESVRNFKYDDFNNYLSSLSEKLNLINNSSVKTNNLITNSYNPIETTPRESFLKRTFKKLINGKRKLTLKK